MWQSEYMQHNKQVSRYSVHLFIFKTTYNSDLQNIVRNDRFLGRLNLIKRCFMAKIHLFWFYKYRQT